MIKFFRKIRQKTLTENKFSKYLLYAIGEIILVVIGILIALSINNWNENRKNKTVEIDYLNGILKNLNSDIAELDRHFKIDTIRLDAYTNLITTFRSNISNLNEQDIIKSFYDTSGYHWFEGQNIIFEDMKSSGKLNFIKSETLRVAIQKYYGFF